MAVATSIARAGSSFRRLFAVSGFAGLLFASPALAQVNPGAIANESRRQQQQLERNLERQFWFESPVTTTKPAKRRPRPAKPAPRTR